MSKPSLTINVPPISNYLEGEARQRARRELLGVLGRDEAWLASAAADRSWIQVLNPVKPPSSLDCVPSDSVGAWEGDEEGAGGAGGGAGVHVQRAERGKHAVGVCDDAAGARGGNDEGAGEAGGDVGGHVQRAGSGKHLSRRLLSDALYMSRSTEVSSRAASPTPSAASSQHSTNPGVSIFPRCKAAFVGSSCKVLAARGGRGPILIDLEAIKKYADQPQHLAASYLNVSLTALKSICRKLGFATWSEVRAVSLTSTAAT